MPPGDDAFEAFIDALQGDEVAREKVNSDADVMALLDDQRGTEAAHPLQYLPRRQHPRPRHHHPEPDIVLLRPQSRTMQADTVLQHSRMYGARDRRDLAVTRFYIRTPSTTGFSQSMSSRTRFNAFESWRPRSGRRLHPVGCRPPGSALRARIRFCSSDVVAVSAQRPLLPTGFQTHGQARPSRSPAELDGAIKPAWRDTGELVTIDRETAIAIIDATSRKALNSMRWRSSGTRCAG